MHCRFSVFSPKKKIVFPIPELIINSLLLAGVVLNIFIAVYIELFLWLFGNLTIIMVFIIKLIENQEKIIEQLSPDATEGAFKKTLHKILHLKLIYKIPVLLLISLPMLFVINMFLLLFGQKPDSVILAFTDTYKHGFSQLEHLCNDVECGDYFLCTPAAKGHKAIVKPERIGT